MAAVHLRRPRGAVRHHAHADPLWLPGANDITAHVDFSAVADAAHGAGLDVLGYTSQARFLMNCGLLGLVPAGDARAAAAAQTLLSEASVYASAKLAEINSRSHFIHDIHSTGGTPRPHASETTGSGESPLVKPTR